MLLPEMIAKQGVNDPEVKKRINDANNTISVNGSLPDTSLQLSEEYLKKNVYTLATKIFNTGTKYFGGIVIAAVVDSAVKSGIDFAYDSLKKPVGNAVKSVGKWVGSLWK